MRLTLHAPSNGLVDHHTTLHGHVFPWHRRVQVLVYSADGEWYQQREAKVDTLGFWEADCVFGCPELPHDFKAVAVAGKYKITERHVSKIPLDLHRSRTITVTRVK